MNELKNLPLSLLQASQSILEAALLVDEEEVTEDAISAMDIPGDDEPQEELSGEKEIVLINPEYKTYLPRRPY